MRNKDYDIIIIGGSYSGLAAAMALGRSLKNVLVIDNGKPCNEQTPYSHNFLTQDGKAPLEIARLARNQVQKYDTIHFHDGVVTTGRKTDRGFAIQTASGAAFDARKLIFTTGIKDLLPDIDGYRECWGISVLHCPYCHGYEVSGKKTGILGNGSDGFEFAGLLSNWTKYLTLYTNGVSTLTPDQIRKLKDKNIQVVETTIDRLEHTDGRVRNVVFGNGAVDSIEALYVRNTFEQYCKLPEALGCELTEEGYIKVDHLQKTTVDGVYAAGDCVSKMRTVANAVATGTAAGMMLNKEMVMDAFRA